MTKKTHSEMAAPAWLSFALLVIRRARVHELAVLTGRQNFAPPRRDGAIRQGYLPPYAAAQAKREALCQCVSERQLDSWQD